MLLCFSYRELVFPHRRLCEGPGGLACFRVLECSLRFPHWMPPRGRMGRRQGWPSRPGFRAQDGGLSLPVTAPPLGSVFVSLRGWRKWFSFLRVGDAFS